MCSEEHTRWEPPSKGSARRSTRLRAPCRLLSPTRLASSLGPRGRRETPPLRFLSDSTQRPRPRFSTHPAKGAQRLRTRRLPPPSSGTTPVDSEIRVAPDSATPPGCFHLARLAMPLLPEKGGCLDGHFSALSSSGSSDPAQGRIASLIPPETGRSTSMASTTVKARGLLRMLDSGRANRLRPFRVPRVFDPPAVRVHPCGQVGLAAAGRPSWGCADLQRFGCKN
jgi:hypothetical protein